MGWNTFPYTPPPFSTYKIYTNRGYQLNRTYLYSMKATTQTKPHSVGYTEGYRLLLIGVVHGTTFERHYDEFCKENDYRHCQASMDLFFHSLKPVEQIEVID